VKSWKIPGFSDSKIYFSMVSINGDTPFHGITIQNPNLKWMITGGTPIPGNLHIDGFPIEMPCIGADDTRGSQLAPGVAEAGVVPAAVPCFKSNEPPLGSING